MNKEQYTFILLLVAVLCIQLCIIIFINFLPTGWDTYFHIKYSTTIIETARIPTVNPYFPEFAHAYTPGAHALLAVVSLVGGIEKWQMLQLFSFLPMIFAAPIILAYYSLASRYVKPKYAILATFLYYFSSLMHPTITATNGALLANSLAYPYIAALVSFVLLPLFITSLVRYQEQRSKGNMIISSTVLAAITLSYHIMAVVAFGLLLTYIVVSFIGGGDRKFVKSLIAVMAISLVISSPYLLHILSAGLPRETGAITTYAVLSIEDYINILHPMLFGALIFCLLLFLVSGKARKTLKAIPLHRLTMLASWVIFLIVAAESYRFGIILVNDRFAWYIIAPTSIIAVIGLSALEEHVEIINHVNRRKVLSFIQSFLVLGAIFSIVLLPEIQELFPFPVSNGSKSFLNQELDGIQWLREHALNAVIVTSPNTGFLISSLADVYAIAIPQVMADYYIGNLEQRINDLKAIFGTGLNSSLQILDNYHVEYIYIGKEAGTWLGSYSLNPYQLLDTPYFKPLFQLKSFIKETADAYDFDGDGVPETFQTFLWNGTNKNSKLYSLTDPNSSTTLTLRCLFHKKGTYGPINIFVNGVNVTQIVASEQERGQWLIYKIEVPKEILREENKVYVENLDPLNTFYLDYIGFGAIPPTDMTQYNVGTVIYRVQYLSTLNVGSEALDLDNDGTLDIFDSLASNSSREYYLYSAFGNETVLTIKDIFRETGTRGPMQAYINDINVGNLTLGEETQRMKWLTHEIRIPENVVKRGWNTIKLINLDESNKWYLSYIQIS
jgi:hypothetical protein